MNEMTAVERRKLTEVYLGVNAGFLGDFENVSVLSEFYAQFNIDAKPRAIAATNRQRFEQILEMSSATDQAAIIRGALEMHPPDPVRRKTRTQDLHDELIAVADRLDGCMAVSAKKPIITSNVVEKAINEAEVLIGKHGFPSAVDRVHTMLHGYLLNVCNDSDIECNSKELMSGLFSKIRANHPAFENSGPRKNEMTQIFRAMSNIMDQLNPIRNEGSMAHPNELLMEPPEAALAINLARTILHYIDMKTVTG